MESRTFDVILKLWVRLSILHPFCPVHLHRSYRNYSWAFKTLSNLRSSVLEHPLIISGMLPLDSSSKFSHPIFSCALLKHQHWTLELQPIICLNWTPFAVYYVLPLFNLLDTSALNENLNRQICLKVLHPSLLN